MAVVGVGRGGEEREEREPVALMAGEMVVWDPDFADYVIQKGTEVPKSGDGIQPLRRASRFWSTNMIRQSTCRWFV